MRGKVRIARLGFTLIELMVVISIILILAGMLLFAMHGAQESARRAKTQSLIAKLDTLIRQRYDGYRARRVPVVYQTTGRPKPAEAALIRLTALRDLMRLEMPDRWTDIVDDPIEINFNGHQAHLPSFPSVTLAYQRRVIAIRGQQTPAQQAKFGVYQGAECLYLIITSALFDEVGGRELFNEGEIGDVDGDGFKEFIDGWGNPIRFLRWAPGFPSELQPHQIYTSYSIQSQWSPTQKNYPNFNWGDPVKNHDPFDSRRLQPEAFLLVPLIFSAGPDQIFDIVTDIDEDPDPTGSQAFRYSQHMANPFYVPPAPSQPIGMPADLKSDKFGPPNGSPDFNDNIHNHLITAR